MEQTVSRFVGAGRERVSAKACGFISHGIRTFGERPYMSMERCEAARECEWMERVRSVKRADTRVLIKTYSNRYEKQTALRFVKAPRSSKGERGDFRISVSSVRAGEGPREALRELIRFI